MKINRKGFTLIELLVTIVIIGLVIGLSTFGIIKVVDSSKNKSTLLTTTNIKESARTYSSEAGSDAWKEGKNYQSFCITIGELINKGILDKKATIPKDLSRDTFVIVNRDKVTLSIVEEAIITENGENYEICTGEASTDEEVITKYPKVGPSINYTDKIVIEFEEGIATYLNTQSETNYTCLYGESSSLINREGKIEGSRCRLNELKNNKDYYVLIYMNTNHGSNIVAEGTKEFYTSNFNKPNITQSSNVVTISYNDKDSNGNNINSPSHYFKSGINGISNINAEKCELKNDIFTCSGSTSSNIEKDVWYKISSSTVNIIYPEENSNFNVSVRIQDGSNNYMTNDKNIIINKYVVKFYKNTASSIDGNTSEYIEKSCINGENKPCNITSPTITAKTGYSTVGWNTSSTLSTSSWNVNTSKSVNANASYYAITKANSYTITYNANGGTGTMASQSVSYDGTASISSNQFTRTGYTFAGWTTNSNGTDDGYGWTNWSDTWKYVNGQYGITNDKLVLYARWKANTYIITYNANGGSGAPGSQTKTYGVNLTLSGTKPTRIGYAFNGWNTKTDGTGTSYSAGATYTSNSGITLYAIWEFNGTVINDNRYTCTMYDTRYRLTVYHVTTCLNGLCAFDMLNGLNNSYSFDNYRGGTPTWSINESSLSSSLTTTINDNCGGWQYFVTSTSPLKCVTGANENVTTEVGTYDRCSFIKGLYMTSMKTSSGGNYYYNSKYNCYLSGAGLGNNPCASSGGSGGGEPAKDPCNCKTSLDCGKNGDLIPSCTGGQCYWCVPDGAGHITDINNRVCTTLLCPDK